MIREAWIRRLGALAFACLIALPASLGAAAPAPSGGVEVLTFHGDPGRTGWNAAESILTPASVGSAAFGRLWASRVEGEIYAEPLIARDVPVGGAARAVVYAVTNHDLVYALDAAGGGRVWGPVSLGTPVRRAALSCGNVDPVGITSTPVIDRASSTLYVVGLTTPDESRTKVYKIGAFDLATGAMRKGWPVVIAPSPASGWRFNPDAQQQRGALALLHGIVYVPFGGYFGDCGDYHGWVVAVPVADPTRQQAFATPTRRMGGIWATGGVAADTAGNLYASTGNSDSEGPADLGNSVIRLATAPALAFSGRPSDFFTPSNFVELNDTDTDLGSSAPLVLPPQRGSLTPDLIFIAGKQGVGYLVNRTNLGGVSRGDGIAGEGVYSRCVFGDCRSGRKVFSATAYWDGGNGAHLILVPGHGGQPAPCRGMGGVVALRLEVSPAGASTFGVAWCSPSMEDPGAPAVSGSGQDGLVWDVDAGSGVLYALRASTGGSVYVSPSQDAPGNVHRFITPAVANGRVYVGAAGEVIAYGMK
jgi:hypothetical protein